MKRDKRWLSDAAEVMGWKGADVNYIGECPHCGCKEAKFTRNVFLSVVCPSCDHWNGPDGVDRSRTFARSVDVKVNEAERKARMAEEEEKEKLRYDLSALGRGDEASSDVSALCAPVYRFKMPPPVDWIIPDWLQAGELHILTGKGGEGKTRLTLQLCNAITLDSAFTDGAWIRPGIDRDPLLQVSRNHRMGRVLYVHLEDSEDKFARRMIKLNPELTDAAQWRTCYEDRFIPLFARGRGPLWNERGWTELGKEVMATAIGSESEEAFDLLVIDTLGYAFGGNENDRAEVSRFMGQMGYFCSRYQIALLMVAHPPKSDAKFSGSTAWEGNARGMWHLARKESKGTNAVPSHLNPFPTLSLEKSSEGMAGAKMTLQSTRGGEMYGAPLTDPPPPKEGETTLLNKPFDPNFIERFRK